MEREIIPSLFSFSNDDNDNKGMGDASYRDDDDPNFNSFNFNGFPALNHINLQLGPEQLWMVMVMVMMVMMVIIIIIITLVTIGDHFMPHLRVSCSMRVPLKPPARSASAFPAWTCLFFNLEFFLKNLKLGYFFNGTASKSVQIYCRQFELLFAHLSQSACSTASSFWWYSILDWAQFLAWK